MLPAPPEESANEFSFVIHWYATKIVTVSEQAKRDLNKFILSLSCYDKGVDAQLSILLAKKAQRAFKFFTQTFIHKRIIISTTSQTFAIPVVVILFVKVNKRSPTVVNR